MSAFIQAKDAFDGILRELGAAAEKLGEHTLVQACWAELERLQEGRLSVVVCGEFKMGKSTLINALLGIPDLVPADFDIATATVIMIRQGLVARAFVVPATGDAPHEINIGDIASVASEAARRTFDAPPRTVLVEAPSTFLDGGLTLIDTPGIGGIARSHSEITFAVMAEADLVLFTSDAQSPLTTNELDFITNRVLPLNRSFALVQTKIDLQAHFEEVTESNSAKLRQILGGDPTVIGVSSRNKLDFVRTGDASDLEDSRFPMLENFVSNTLRKNGQTRIVNRAAEATTSAAQKLIEPRRAELIALNGRGTPEFQAMERDIRETKARIEHLRLDHSQWRNRLSLEMSDLREKAVNRGLARKLIEIETKFKATAVRTNASGDELSLIALGLEEEVKHAFIAACHEIASGVDDVRSTLAMETGLPLTSIVRDPDQAVRPAPVLNIKTTGWMTKTAEWANQWRRHVIGSATAGAIAGGIVGAVIGFFAGGVGALPGFYAGAQIGGGLGTTGGALGGISSANKHVREKKMRDARETLESELIPYLRLVSRESTDRCHELLAQLKTALIHEFDLRIRDALTDLHGREEALKRGIETQREIIKARRETLVQELRLLEGLRTRSSEIQKSFTASQTA